MDGAIQRKGSCHEKFTGLTLECLVKTLTLKSLQQGKKGKEMELLLVIALGLSAVGVIGQFGDALVRRLTGKIAI
ncbi:MAG TPA: hypothetical protein VIN58_08170 [Roseateles sp.]